jgi:4-hydroxy-3-methylbut-2-enyl diphosphate reductase IspH
MREILAAVRELPRHEQDVLALCVFADLSYADAAIALGVPVGASAPDEVTQSVPEVAKLCERRH